MLCIKEIGIFILFFLFLHFRKLEDCFGKVRMYYNLLNKVGMKHKNYYGRFVIQIF
jgi:hypothetical protein